MSDSFLYSISSLCDGDHWLRPQLQLNVEFLPLAIWRSTKRDVWFPQRSSSYQSTMLI